VSGAAGLGCEPDDRAGVRRSRGTGCERARRVADELVRVELAGGSRRPDEITEQHGQVPAFGLGRPAFDGSGCARRGGRVTAPNEDATVLIPGDTLRVEELVLQCLEGLVVALELYLQRSIRDARAATQELHRTIDDLLKPHDSYSDRRWD
jgi:hypothetical protein